MLQPIRRIPDPSELMTLVTTLLANWIGQLAEFTAYSVTLELRAANPDLEIAHDDVRFLVADEMAPRLGVTYMTEQRDWFGTIANTYVPAANVVQQPGQKAFTAPKPQLPTGSIFKWDDEA